MAPERFHGRCDARSDVYGLGLTLYELLARRPAFDASDRNRLLHQVSLVEPTRLRKLDPSIPRDLETIVHKAIEKDPAHRYPTAGALAEDLRCLLEDRPIRARRATWPERAWRWSRRNRATAALAIVAAVSLLTAAIVGWVGYVNTTRALADESLRRQEAEAATSSGRGEHDTLPGGVRGAVRAPRSGRHAPAAAAGTLGESHAGRTWTEAQEQPPCGPRSAITAAGRRAGPPAAEANVRRNRTAHSSAPS